MQCAQRLASFLKGLGVATVLQLQTARSLALSATGSDFVTRFRASFPAVPSQLTNSPVSGSSPPATSAQPVPLQATPSATPPGFQWQVPGNTVDDNTSETCTSRDQPNPDKECCKGSLGANTRLPMLISACPGEPLITHTLLRRPPFHTTSVDSVSAALTPGHKGACVHSGACLPQATCGRRPNSMVSSCPNRRVLCITQPPAVHF